MTPGLLAPQFGLGRSVRAEPREACESAIQHESVASGFSRSGPVVVVKRRRMLERSDAVPLDEHQAPTEVRSSKVHRLPAPAGEALASIDHGRPASVDGDADGVLSVAQDPRIGRGRRQDSARSPTLIRHEVFESSASGPEPEPEPVQQPSMPERLLASPEVSMADVLDAMARLRSTTDAMVRARAAFIALDMHLTALGLPSASLPVDLSPHQ